MQARSLATIAGLLCLAASTAASDVVPPLPYLPDLALAPVAEPRLVLAPDPAREALARTLVCDPAIGARLPLGETEVTCAWNEASGGPSTTFRVRVVDSAAPILRVTDTIAAAQGPWGASVPFQVSLYDHLDAFAAADCVPAPGTIFPLGRTRVECGATDASRNTALASFEVDVRDITPPSIHAPDWLIIPHDGAPRLDATIRAEDDVTGPLPVTCDPPVGARLPLGQSRVHCRAVDAAGNVATRAILIAVVDVVSPWFGGPRAITLEAEGPWGAQRAVSIPADDDIDRAVATECGLPPGDVFPAGATSVRCWARDSAGHLSEATLEVRVVDTTPPRILVPPPTTYFLEDRHQAPVPYEAGALDLVDGVVPLSCTPASGSRLATGSRIVVCVASDRSLNTATASFEITVLPRPCDVTWLSPSVAQFPGPARVQVRLACAQELPPIPARLYYARVADGVAQAERPFPGEGGASHLVWGGGNGVWDLPFSTRDTGHGEFRLRVDVGDGIPHSQLLTVRS